MAIINNTPPSHSINDTTPQSTNTNHILITERKSNISENQNDILISTSLHYIFLLSGFRHRNPNINRGHLVGQLTYQFVKPFTFKTHKINFPLMVMMMTLMMMMAMIMTIYFVRVCPPGRISTGWTDRLPAMVVSTIIVITISTVMSSIVIITTTITNIGWVVIYCIPKITAI